MKSIKYALITNTGISAFGYSLYIIGLGVALLELSGDPASFVYVMLGFFLSSLVSTGLSIYLSKRVEAIKLNLIVDSLRIATCATMIVLLSLNQEPRLLIVTSVVLSVLTQLFRTNTISIVGTLFTGEELTSYLAKVNASVQVGGFVGGILIGIIISQFHYELAFYINTLCFVISFLAYTYVSLSKEATAVLDQQRSHVVPPSSQVWRSLQANALNLVGLVLGTLGIAIANISLAPVIESVFDNDFMWLSAIEVMMCLAAFSSVLLTRRKTVLFMLPVLFVPIAFAMIASEFVVVIISGFFACSLASIYLQTTCLSRVTNGLPPGYKGYGYMIGQLMTSLPLIVILVLFELNNQSFQHNLILVSIGVATVLAFTLILQRRDSSDDKIRIQENT